MDDLEERVERLEEAVEMLTRQLEELVDTVDKLNKNQMSKTYVDLVKDGKLEEMREKYPETVKELEEAAEEHISPLIEEIEEGDY